MSKHILFFVILFLPIWVFAQKQVTVSGYITDIQTGERLYAATIYEQNTGIGTSTNRFGFFSLPLTKGTTILKISFVGYDLQAKLIDLKTDTLLVISLKSDNKIDEITIKGNSSYNNIGHQKISTKMLAKLPSLMGEKDVMKSLMILPGVQQGSEGSTGIYVRGGSPDQNLILLDDVPLYNVSHLFGLVSIFTPEAITSIDFYKGGFPARYGGRLSSVVDLRMKDGNKFKRESSLTLGLISSQLTTEGPIKRGESSYFFSVRRTLLDILVTQAVKMGQKGLDEKVIPGYNFYDINGKVNFKLNAKNHLFWSFYSGNDKLSIDYSNHSETSSSEENQNTFGSIHWGNMMTAFKLNTQLKPDRFLNTTLSGSVFNYGNLFKGNSEIIEKRGDDSKSSFWYKYRSQIRTISLKSDCDIFGSTGFPAQLGLFVSVNNYIPGQQQYKRNEEGTEYTGRKISSLDYGFYFDKKTDLSKRLSMTTGFRTSFYSIFNEKTYLAFEPRVNLTYRPNDNTSYLFSYSRMSQPIHLLSNGNIGLPTDIWVPSTKLIHPETSSILSVGAKKTISPELKFSAEAYYKWLNHVVSFADGSGILDMDENWDQKVKSGKGRCKGVETELKYSNKKIESWIGYTLSRNERKFEGFNQNQWYPYQYDRRHKLDVGIIWQLGKQWSATATWTFQSGAPATYSGLYYSGYPNNLNYLMGDLFTSNDIDNGRIQYYIKINGVRLPAYHHLDLGLTREWESSGKKRTLSFSIYNAYSRQNPYLIYTYTKSDGTTGLKQFCLLPIIPSVSYRISF